MSVPENILDPDYEMYTDRVINQLVGSALVEACIAKGATESEAITHAVSVTASSFFDTIPVKTHEPEYLSVWYRSVRDQCSKRYEYLQEQNSSASRLKLNEDPTLQRLNAVRKGLSIAVRTSYTAAQKKRFRTP